MTYFKFIILNLLKMFSQKIRKRDIDNNTYPNMHELEKFSFLIFSEAWKKPIFRVQSKKGLVKLDLIRLGHLARNGPN